MRRPLVISVALTLLLAGCTGSSTDDTLGSSTAPPDGAATESPPASTTTTPQSFAGHRPAPEFPPGLDWLNVDAPLTLAALHGKVVLLDFWTYGCINCIHVLPDLKRLEVEFADELVVIGVHSAKFANEGDTENIRQVILRYGIEHPVVNDAEFEVWNAWGTNSWPTTVIIDPAGNVVGGHSGEGVYDVAQPVIASLVAEFDARGQITAPRSSSPWRRRPTAPCGPLPASGPGDAPTVTEAVLFCIWFMPLSLSRGPPCVAHGRDQRCEK